LDPLPVLHGVEPLERADRSGTRPESRRRPADDLPVAGGDRPAEAGGRAQRRGRMRRGRRGGRAQGPSRGREKKGREGRRRRLKGAPGRGTLEKEKPPIFGMIQRTGEVVIRMLANVRPVTIEPLIRTTIAPGSVIYTDEYDIYHRLDEWGY